MSDVETLGSSEKTSVTPIDEDQNFKSLAKFYVTEPYTKKFKQAK